MSVQGSVRNSTVNFMNTPNPADIFGRRTQSRDGLETPVYTYDRETLDMSKDGEASNARAVDFQLGNHELPIAHFREQIISSVVNNQATVITAETGAGKSTQVPQFLAEAGYEVIVTQPRVVAARSVAERVQTEVVEKYGADFKDFVGYRTARERGDNPANQILFATDGLQLVRELSGNGVGKKQVLVLDEVHEWNENMEVLVAWAKQHMADDPNFKVVTMSATMEAEKLSNYFADYGKREVPVVEVPGRTFEVKKSEGGDVANEAIKFAKAGKNTLVFVPGKQEIDQVIAQIERANIPGATILPLHGQMEKEDQRKVFNKQPGVKIIVATNVAQTSVTIEDIDAVVDSGLERQNQVKNGVEGLYLNPISQADCLQRAGRAGRTKDGEYVLAQLDNNPFVGMNDRQPYSTPEILRTRLDGMVLRLAKNGFDASAMEFYHQPDHGQINNANKRLQKLGALSEDGTITKVGRDMERMPVESHYARMMIEARQFGPEVQLQLATLLAVQEADGICQFATKSRPCDERWRQLLVPGMNDSDMIKQLELFIAAERMSDKEKRDNNLYVKAISKAREVLRQLRGIEKLGGQDITRPTVEQRGQLIKCVLAGMVDNLYVSNFGDYSNASGDYRAVSSKRMISPANMVVGMPFDLEVNTRRGNTTLHLIEHITNVPSVETLREVAPQLFSERDKGLFIGNEGLIYQKYTHMFNGQDTGEEGSRPAEANEKRQQFLARRIVEKYWYLPETQETLRQVEDLNNRIPGSVGVIRLEDIVDVVEGILPLSVDTLEAANEYVPVFGIDDLVSPVDREKIIATTPDSINGMPVIYKDGVPTIRGTLPEDNILDLDVEAMKLPDGREARIAYGWQGSIGIAEYQARIIQQRQAQQERHERNIERALEYLRAGYDEYNAGRFIGDAAAANEATWLYKNEQTVAVERAAVYVERMVAVLDGLRVQTRDLYSRSQVEDIEDLPHDITQPILAIQDELSALTQEVEFMNTAVRQGARVETATYEARIAQAGSRLGQALKVLERWRLDEQDRASKPVTTDDLRALMNKFNRH